jgi:hypothetical protein
MRLSDRDPKEVFKGVLWSVGVETRKGRLKGYCGDIERVGVLTIWLNGLLAGHSRDQIYG